MNVLLSASARGLGLRHPRVWSLKSGRPLLSGTGIGAEEAAAFGGGEHPPGYRDLLAALGHPGTVPAGERLRRTVAERGWRSHGPVVDAVNAATMEHGGGIGLHRADDTGGARMLITRAPAGLRMVPAFSDRSRPVPEGDLVYGLHGGRDGEELRPMAWLGRRDCDSADFQLLDDTTEAVMVVLGCPGTGAGHTAEAGGTVLELLARLRPDITATELVVTDAP
ncbi:hypothetical protein [Streptomyces atacamensis]|uniref:hypothetical protein n=1 Tax=Streptomyces atacamensis TaxID=531966 RepID=UPI00399D05CA